MVTAITERQVPKRTVELVEVAPRDGFQSIADPIGTEKKIAIIEALLDAGYRRMEIGSFVSPRAVPQMADMPLIANHFRHRADVELAALAPNRKGTELALQHGIKALVYVFSASEAHNLSNVRQTVSQSLAQLKEISELLDNHPEVQLRVAVATSFDCPFDGTVPLAALQQALGSVVEIAPGAEIALCDTTGRATPHQVRQRFASLMEDFGDSVKNWAFHGHDTFGMGVANALFAYETGVRSIDVSASGLGGCPFAPGATGNTAAEDLVFAFEQDGITTGISLAKLLEVSDSIKHLPGACVGGHLRDVPRKRAVGQ